MSTEDRRDILQRLKLRQTLPPEDLARGLRVLMQGHAEEGQIGAFLMGLGPENETPAHITQAAKVLREKAVDVKAPDRTVDCCGTGGDGLKTFNISTAVALVAAACGVPVAKHGNRAASSASGAADILEALDIDLISEPGRLEQALRDIGFAFLMAPHHHKSMAHVAKIRKQLKFRTMFNLLGPLSNPAGAKIQLVGVYERKWLVPIAKALGALGADKALVVHGEDGLDEITLAGKTFCAEWNGDEVLEYYLKPEDFGLSVIRLEDIQGGSPETNATALIQLLDGKKSSYRDIVLANTAALLRLTAMAASLEGGVKRAQEAIDSGAARKILEQYQKFCKGA